MDERVQVGVSSCGFYELIDDFNDHDRSFSNAVFALPGLANVGRSADYLAQIAPRPVLLTRGEHELATDEGSREHVEQTRRLESYARERYRQLGAADRLSVLYFDGGHAFPERVRGQAYAWLDRFLVPHRANASARTPSASARRSTVP